MVTGESLTMELLKTEKGNATAALSQLQELQNASGSHHRAVRFPHITAALLNKHITALLTEQNEFEAGLSRRCHHKLPHYLCL